MDRKNTWITMSDQAPVWLKPAAGKMATSLVRLRASKEQQKRRRERRKARQEGSKAAIPQRDLGPRIRSAQRSPGQAPRWRVSLVCRQRVRGYFDPAKQPQGGVSGSILVVYGCHCRLENISETGTWIQTERFVVNDREIVREAGARVPGSVMKTWRKARRDHPHLFADQAVSAKRGSGLGDFSLAVRAREVKEPVGSQPCGHVHRRVESQLQTGLDAPSTSTGGGGVRHDWHDAGDRLQLCQSSQGSSGSPPGGPQAQSQRESKAGACSASTRLAWWTSCGQPDACTRRWSARTRRRAQSCGA